MTLCDLCSPITVIPYSPYAKTYNDISRGASEPIDIIIKLADKIDREPFDILIIVNVILGFFIYQIDIFVLGMYEDDRPIVSWTTFLNAACAEIN